MVMINKQSVEALTREAVSNLPKGTWLDLRWVAQKEGSESGLHTWRIGLLYKGDRPITIEVSARGKSHEELQHEILEKLGKAVQEKRG